MPMTKSEIVVLPAIRGFMGDWVYYSTLMSFDEISKRLQYAQEITSNNIDLSEEMQRETKIPRGVEIADYIRTQPEHFFNSLVVAVYGGDPKWHTQKNIEANEKYLKELDEEIIESIGFLKFDGTETLFAIDGQHRLAGIRSLLEDDPENKLKDEKISVIFVGHKKTLKGLQRTRRLFTTLNKKAQPVSKGDIIILDEDDVMAICTRWLLEREFLRKEMIVRVASNNMPSGNQSALTTIGNLYDILLILFSKASTDLKERKKYLQDKRPTERELEKYFNLSKKYFSLLRESFSEIDELFNATNTEDVVKKYRGSHGGNALFRPKGLEIFTLIIAILTSPKDKNLPLKKAVEVAAKLPRKLDEPPYEGVIWDSKTKTILRGGDTTLRNILLYMLSSSVIDEKKLKELKEKYRDTLGDPCAELPDRVF